MYRDFEINPIAQFEDNGPRDYVLLVMPLFEKIGHGTMSPGSKVCQISKSPCLR